MEIPKEIKLIASSLNDNGFESYLVGGCVRDILRKVKPKDWDFATNANPEEILKIFKNSFSENKFGTVTILPQLKSEIIEKIEITPYRIECGYGDKRHPDKVKWVKKIEEDLKRRDFTINAIAAKIKGNKIEIKDLFSGIKDLEKGIIKAVGEPEERFNEDALRMMRAVRFATVFNFKIENKTKEAIKKNSSLLEKISKERIRDEFIKIIMSKNAADGIEKLRELGLLKIFIPELEEGYDISQNKHHIHDCYKHSVLSLEYAAKKGFNKYVRLAALLHDIGKPKTKNGEGEDATFYGHEIVGAKMTHEILSRLKFSKKDINKIVRLVRYHLFYYNVGEVGEASVRKLVRKVFPENMEELLQVRMADRIGSGVPKAEPYKLRHLKYLIEKVSQNPISVKMLCVGGEDIINTLKISPGPKIGMILDILLGIVLANPENNKKEILIKKAKELGNLSDSDLEKASKKAKEEREKIETKRDEMTKKKYWVT